MEPDRYHRQKLLPFIGNAGQERLSASRVLLIGCGALGSVLAEQLVRAGVGHLSIVDRDVVEWTNLQRQLLFDESHARQGIPKAIAAAERLNAINSEVSIQPHVVDLHSGNIESFADRIDLIADGTDNAQTRYLINDLAVKQNIPWVYGACVGTDGRVMTIRPGITPCLACIYPEPPGTGELATCDTVGVLGPAIAVVAGYQSAAILKLLSGHADATDTGLLTIDFWKNRHRTIDTGKPREGCICCDERKFVHLDRPVESSTAALCGRNSVQVRPASVSAINLQQLAETFQRVGRTESSIHLLRVHLNDPSGIVLTVFPDGRCIVAGTTDLGRARSVVNRYLGS